jgi:hypothetical protein
MCGAEAHDFAALPPEPYAYLLGVYLGDGTLGNWGGGWVLRIALDEAYPGIVACCCDAIETLRGGSRPVPRRDYGGKRCVRIESTWRQWPCLLPQHGAGRKHHRTIELVPWQRAIVDEVPGAFLRGLVHSDGWRGLNRVTVKGKEYAYPRYQFSNRSDDIRKLFTDACDRLGVRWRPWTRYHVSVAQRESVAVLDSLIGPKW